MATAGEIKVKIKTNSAEFEAACARLHAAIENLPPIHIEIVEDKGAKHMNRLAAIIAAIHNAWLTIPLGIRTAISFSLAAVTGSAIALVHGYGWFIPSSPDAVKGEAIAFLSYATPILAVLVAQLVRSKIAPAIVTWFLSTFGYAPTASFAALRSDAKWVRI